jgi:hypothetical protein
MSKLLFSLGLLANCIGLVTLGFGIPVNAFSIGNTLIVSGTLLVAAGLILIGLWAVLRQLQVIAQVIREQAVGALAVRASVAASVPSEGVPAAVDTLPGADSEPNEGSAPLNWLRAKSKPGAVIPPANEPPVVAPLAEAISDSPAPAVPLPQRPRFQRPLGEPVEETETTISETAWSEPSSGIGSEVRVQQKERVAASNFSFSPSYQRDARAAVLAPPPQKPSLLKAGVIDGMAYRLYSDGSIEAEMPQGPIKFSSIDALRLHLEKQN